MQCHAMSCRTSSPNPSPFLNRLEGGNQNQKKGPETRAAYCFGQGENATFIHPIRTHPSIEHQPNPNRPLPHARGGKQKPRLRKVAPVFKKASRSFRSLRSRKQSTQVTSTVMSCLETTGTTAERLRAHAADTTAGLAHTALALGATPAGRRPLANAQGAYATGGTATTWSLGSACGR